MGLYYYGLIELTLEELKDQFLNLKPGDIVYRNVEGDNSSYGVPFRVVETRFDIRESIVNNKETYNKEMIEETARVTVRPVQINETLFDTRIFDRILKFDDIVCEEKVVEWFETHYKKQE